MTPLEPDEDVQILYSRIGKLQTRLLGLDPTIDSDQYRATFRDLIATELLLRNSSDGRRRCVTIEPDPILVNARSTKTTLTPPSLDSPERLESEIERMYWTAYQQLMLPDLTGMVTQHEVLGGKYRIDFALPAEKIGVEVDGYAYHSDPAVFTQDRKRQRELETEGWRLIRFSGKEVRADAQLCVIQPTRLVRVFRGEGEVCW
jgi:very-short-patch-repair endonuclease